MQLNSPTHHRGRYADPLLWWEMELRWVWIVFAQGRFDTCGRAQDPPLHFIGNVSSLILHLSSFIFHPLIFHLSSSHLLILSSSHLFILSSVHLFLASFDHISDLLHTRMLVRAVEETRVIGQRTDETVMRIEPVVDEHVAES